MNARQRLNTFLIAFTCAYGLVCGSTHAAETESTRVFKYHMVSEPITMDPAAFVEATGGVFFYNIYRSLMRLNAKNESVPELAESCTATGLKWVCVIHKDAKFSDGTPILASHFIKSWQRLFNPTMGSRHADLLLSVKNAKSILKGEMQADALAVKALEDRTLEVELAEVDPDFVYKLASPVLAPLSQDPPKSKESYKSAQTTGPYRIKEWDARSRILLEPNPFYFRKKNQGPMVEVLVVDDDTTAQQMYDLGRLTFLRRIPTKEIPLRNKKSDFYFVPVLRFDYMGFGPSLRNEKALRQSLAKSLNFKDMKKLFETPGEPGCSSLPRPFMKGWPCQKMDAKVAKKLWAKIPESTRKRALTLIFNQTNGEDEIRSMEWMQHQWKKNLGARVELRGLERGMYYQELRIPPPDLFRRGYNLDRPTCLAALDDFSKSDTESKLKWDDKELDEILNNLRLATDEPGRQKYCGLAMAHLINEFMIIPLGEMYFAVLAKPQFTGWRVTSLNQLDLTDLTTSP